MNNKFQIFLRIFVYGDIISLFTRGELLTCESFKSCPYHTLKIEKSISKNEINCLDYPKKKFSFAKYEKIKDATMCLQECIKPKLRINDFFYSKYDEDHLNFSAGNYHLLDKNYLEYCQNRCKETPCISHYFIHQEKIYKKNQQSLEFKISSSIYTTESVFYINVLNFFRKFFGLISLFFKFSILSLVLKLNSTFKKILQKKIFNSIADIVLWTSLVTSFFYGSFLGSSIYKEYIASNLTTYIFIDLPFVPSNFSLAICKIFSFTENGPISKIENQAIPFNSSSIFLIQFGDEFEKLIYKKVESRFFYKSLNRSYTEQCFVLDISIEEYRYRSLLSLTKLVINTTVDLVYLEEFNKSITNNSFKLGNNLKLTRVEEHHVNNCSNYEIETKGDCDSRSNCLNECYNDEYLNTFKKLPCNSVVYLDDYSNSSKNYLFFDYESTQNSSIKKKCEEKFKKKDCNLVKFYSDEEETFDKNYDILKLDFFYPLFVQGNSLDKYIFI